MICDISPADFIRRVFFHIDWADEQICVATSPYEYLDYSRVWQDLPALTYFNISTLVHGPVVRREVNCARHHVCVFDDVGTKAERQMYVLPHYVLETSDGNTQEGFLLDPEEVTPQTSANYKAFLGTCVEAGLTDAGAKGVNRLMRLPGSVHPSGFVSRIIEWRPLLERWRLRDLCDKMKLDWRRGVPILPVSVSKDEMRLDVVVRWLSEHKMIRHVEADKVCFRCPFDHDTGGPDRSRRGEAAYFVGSGNFHCFHATCCDDYSMEQVQFQQWIFAQGGPDLRCTLRHN